MQSEHGPRKLNFQNLGNYGEYNSGRNMTSGGVRSHGYHKSSSRGTSKRD
jgi:hypothetical protein